MTYLRGVRYDDSANIDAFSRLRVSDPATLFVTQSQYDADPLQMETGATGTGIAGVHSANTRMVALSCTAGTGTAFIQSYEYIPYQPGKSQLIAMTGLLDTGVAGAVVDIGAFDAANGIFLRQNGASGLQLVRRTSTSGSVVNNTVAQASWNVDPMDGTGPSGVTLDVTKVFILFIDAQFLGMGRVRVGFDVDGVLCYVHEFRNANVLAVPYVQTLSLPVQMLVTATATASSKTAYFKCAAVSSEGGLSEDVEYVFSTPETTVTAGSGTNTHIAGIRPRTTFNSIVNRARIRCRSVDVIAGNNAIYWQLCFGSTFSVAPTYSNISTSLSTVEYVSTPGTVTSVGTPIANGYIGSTGANRGSVAERMDLRLPLTLDRAGAVRANGALHLFVAGIGGTSASRAALNVGEIR